MQIHCYEALLSLSSCRFLPVLLCTRPTAPLLFLYLWYNGRCVGWCCIGFHIPHNSTYGDNAETPVHYGHQAVTTWRVSVWIALSLHNISLHSLPSVRTINNVSCVTLPASPPVSMLTQL